MRMFIGAVGLTGAALFLQGCASGGSSSGGGNSSGGGGGSGNVTTTCKAPHLELVSQSISGTLSSNVSGSMSLTIPPSNFDEKIDFERFNLHTMTSSSTDFTDPSTNMTRTVKADLVQIINLAEKHAISYTEVNDPLTGNITKACWMIPLPHQLPDAKVLAEMFKVLISAAECGSSDGTDDTWKLSKSYDGPIPDGILPVPTAGFTVSGSGDVKITVNPDSLLHSASEALKVDVMANSSTLYSLDISSDITISSAKAGGPSDEDLDPKQFDVECMTPDDINVSTFFTSNTPSVFQKHALATLQAALQPQHVLIAV